MDYTVKIGDTLSIIARDVLGNMELWPEIAKINNIENPNLIFPGMLLQLPVDGVKNNKTIVPLLTALSLAIVGGILWFASTRSSETTNKTSQVTPKVTPKINPRLRFGRGSKTKLKNEN